MDGTSGEVGGILWLIMNAVAVAALGAVMAYAVLRWRNRRRRPPLDRQAEERKARQLAGRD